MKSLRVAAVSASLALPFALVTFAASEARADERAACVEAASQGQTLRDAHKLIEARDQFRLCAQQRCPAVVQKDCAGWLEAAERSVPTVVVTAKDDRGADLPDVAVTVDGQPFAAKLDGNALPLDPGRHSFHFEWSGGPPVDQAVVVREGEKDQHVAAVLVRTGAPPGAVSGVDSASHEGAQPAPSGSGLKTAGWVIGAVGVVGLAVGGTFAGLAIGDKKDAACNAANECQAGPLSRAKTAAIVADVGLIGGGVLFAVGAGLVLFSPSGAHGSTGQVRLAPTVGSNGGGVTLAGSW
jgi:hypothetical protein